MNDTLKNTCEYRPDKSQLYRANFCGGKNFFLQISRQGLKI